MRKRCARPCRKYPDIRKIEVEPGGASGRLAVTVESAPGEDVRSQIAAKIVGKGWPLYELRGVNLSLEDIFLQLTTDDSAHAAANAPEEREKR